MFLFKKIVGPLFLPLKLCFILILVGLCLVWFQKKGRLGKLLLTIGVLLLMLLSYSVIADRIIAPLECRYPPVHLQDAQGVKWIAVLGGGFQAGDRCPPTSQLASDSLARLAEGIRLYRTLPHCKLLLSGGAVFDPVSEAEVMSRAALALGVRSQDIVLETTSRDTEDQAQMIRDMVKEDQFLLVTSAVHMPRAMALFKKAGMNPVAAPAGFFDRKEKRRLSPEEFFPNAEALQKSDRAVHEYLGIVWAKLRGKL